MEEDGFKLVRNKKQFRNKKLAKLNQTSNLRLIEQYPDDLQTSIRKIEHLERKVVEEPLCEDLLSQFKSVVTEDHHYDEIVSYGLGSISSCRVARIQLALLLRLQKHLAIPVESYDPAFSEIDKAILKNFGIKVIEKNEKCMRKVNGKRVIFYMPHCDFPLYNNLLWANWNLNDLSCVSIFGNSLSRIVRQHIKQDFIYVDIAQNLCCEYLIPTNVFSDAFNDTAIITFSKEALQKADKSVWQNKEPPAIQESDKFIY